MGKKSIGTGNGIELEFFDPVGSTGGDTGGNSETVGSGSDGNSGNTGAGSEPGNGTNSRIGRGKRGRPKGSRNKRTEVSADLGRKIKGIHELTAIATGLPELAISEREAEELAKAFADIQREYGTVIDPKVMCWFNLAATAGIIYGPRGIAIYYRKKNAAKKLKFPKEETKEQPDEIIEPQPPVDVNT